MADRRLAYQRGKISLARYMFQRWIDENLGWEPEEYNGLEKIMFPATHIWVPDIYIFNV